MKENDVPLRVIFAGIHDIGHKPAPARINDHRRLPKQWRPRQQKTDAAQQNRGNRPHPTPLFGCFLSHFFVSSSRVPRQIYLRDKLEFR